MANFNLDVTLTKALEHFQNRDAFDMARKSGAEFKDNQFYFDFLNSSVQVGYPDGTAVFQDTRQEIGLIERILLLHYLVHAGGSSLTGKIISFKELPGGSIYIEPFTNRCIRPLTFLFGKDLEGFRQAAELCGGIKQSFGDISYCFKALPNIPVTFVLWAEDDEFPANANIIFDETASDYLPTEDYAFLCGMVVGMLKNAKGVNEKTD
ncbi:MAG: DUF3786 domain-containing protein [Bacillota bacterium]|nr:DUF3786 domain-containing protein [Clostridia bacterium]